MKKHVRVGAIRWNEHDEGGWLCLTWSADGQPNTSRLDRIGQILL